MNKRVVFMGTPYFAKKVLETLIENNVNVVAVVTQPDKPVGRKQILTPSEVKEYALSLNIDVLQPVKIKNEYQDVLNYKPDMIITCAFGQFIPSAILDYCFCLNVHGSLLPKYRGGAPMQRAILNDDKKTGITIMTMSTGMDAGDIITQDEIEITNDDTYGTVEEKMIACACPLLIRTLDMLDKNEATFTKQNEDEVVLAPIIKKEEEILDLTSDYRSIYNKIRALSPAPYAYCLTCDNLKLKVCKARETNESTNALNGTIIGLFDKGMAVSIDSRIMLFDEVLLEGKNKISAKEFLNGAGRKLINTQLK